MAASASNPLVSLLGETVCDKNDDNVSVAALSEANDAIGLYFSAHWCGPCRGFTPKLAEAYKGMQGKKKFEVVFVSSDKGDSEFDSYFATMPWKALPFADRERKAKLSKKFKVNGIPSLVIIDAKTAEIITDEGRARISADPAGDEFPWRPPTLAESLGTEFIKGSGADRKPLAADALRKKTLGVYFSAHWCPPCKTFTPQLVSVYNKLQAKGEDFEILFVSSDRSEAAFNEYFAEMPWASIPFADEKRRQALSAVFKVQGIPTFVVLDGETLDTITDAGRAMVSDDPEGANFPWIPPTVMPTSSSWLSAKINESPSLILLKPTKGAADSLWESDAAATAAKAAFVAAAEADTAAVADPEDAFAFYYQIADPLMNRVLDLSKPADGTALVIVDVAVGGSFHKAIPLGEVTQDAVAAFLAEYRAGSLTKKPFNG